MMRRVFWSVVLLIVAVGPTAACGDDGGKETPEAAPASAGPSAPSDNSGQICTEWRAAFQRTIGPDSTKYADARKAAQAAFDAGNAAIGTEQAKVMAQLHAEWGVESTRLAGLAESAALKTALQAMGGYLTTYPAEGGFYNVDRRTALVNHALATLAACPDRTPLPSFPPL